MTSTLQGRVQAKHTVKPLGHGDHVPGEHFEIRNNVIESSPSTRVFARASLASDLGGKVVGVGRKLMQTIGEAGDA
jgi:hypothetical protein